MNLNFRKKRYFALAGNSKSTILAEVIKMSTPGNPALHVLAETEGTMDRQVTINRLLASAAPDIKGQISLVLPLNFFDIVTVPIPIVNEEAVAKALPYHLAKMVDKPLSEYIYDWQITRRHKGSIEATVYLFAAKTFEMIRRELGRKQLDVQFMEADVFAAFAYMDLNNRLQADDVTLCTLIWAQSLSMAVYEAGQLKLVRTVKIAQPEGEYNQKDLAKIPEEESAGTITPESQEFGPDIAREELLAPNVERDDRAEILEVVTDEVASDVLAGFALYGDQPLPATPPKNQDEEEPLSVVSASVAEGSSHSRWLDYLHHINLEIIRTRDYYASIVKGSAINNLVVEGADICRDDLRDIIQKSMGLEMRPLTEKISGVDSTPALNTMCVGTGARW